MGRRTFEIDREDLVLPAGFDLVEVKPSRVRVSVKMMRETPGAEERPPGSAPRTGNGAGRSSAQPGVASR
jgi:hypothetical protein